MKNIFHITSKTEWESARAKGIYTAPSLEKQGFIHCSLAHQIPPVANFNFKGQQGLVLLVIDQKRLQANVKFEDLYNEGKEYPHIYGPLNTDAVIRVVNFPPNQDGTFSLPKELE